MPKALLGRPDPLPGAEIYLSAFWDLSGDRPLGAMGGAGSIPFLALDRWAIRNGFDEAAGFERLRMVIKKLDGVYLGHMARRAKNPNKRGY
ncbi:hypothetical protein ASE61_15085 [Bosea sp. Root670]|uniref:phage tail assembly chaperone n=1 Tax=Bosea sp. Root670 TaxID=1736583 RepID=UPI000714A2F6|nr:hypothetical protein [Bosea sp. Root670]KRE02599.1 hypothetical protein ASE61_15085 [Bosea sp. Root670]